MDLLASLRTGALIVVCAPHAARQQVTYLATELALRGSLTVLDGGNRFQPYRVTQLLRRKTIDLNVAASRLLIRRAFTCYQMLALLENTSALNQPYLILDLLATFYDDHTSTPEARRLLLACLAQIDRLCLAAPVIVTLAPALTAERAFLVEIVCARADQVFIQTAPDPGESQLSFWD